MGKAQSTDKGARVSSNPAGASSDVTMRNKKPDQKGKGRPASYQGEIPVSYTDASKRNSDVPESKGRTNQKSKEMKNPLLNIMADESKYASMSAGKSSTLPVSTSASREGAASATGTAAVQKPTSRDSVMQTSDVKVIEIVQHPAEELDKFSKVMDQVALIWPKFERLKTLDSGLFSVAMLPLLKEVCEELVQEYTQIRDYRTQIQGYKDQVEPAQHQLAVMSNVLQERDAEIATMKDTIAKLQTNSNDPGYTSGSDELEDKTGTVDQSLNNQPVLSDGSVDPDDSARMKSRIKEGIYQATPLLLAEGKQRSNAAVKRSHSNLKPVSLDQSPGAYERLPPIRDSDAPLPLDADADDKIRYLEEALQRERNENIFLRDRVKSYEPSNDDSIYEVLPRRTIDSKELVIRYRSLEEHALGRLYGAVKQNLKDAPDKRRGQFICSVMEVSYTKALSSVLRFSDAVQDLLSNPMSVLNSQSASAVPRRASDVRGQDRRANQRSKPVGHLPDMLLKQITMHLQKTADVTDIAALTESVVDGLRRSYSDCATTALLSQSIFVQFLSDCCRLAWQMAVVNPPLYISTETFRMDDRIHETLMQETVTNAQVDHYLWPTLFDRKNGHVLYKGRVVIKTV